MPRLLFTLDSGTSKQEYRALVTANAALTAQLGKLSGSLSQAESGLKKIAGDLGAMRSSLGATQQQTRGLGRELDGLRGRSDSVGSAFGRLRGALATLGIGLIVKESVDAALALNRAERTLYAVTGTAELAAKEFAFVRAESERLGLQLSSTAQDYARISAAAKNTTLEGAGVRDIFQAVAETGTVLSLSADEMKGALNALAQMIGKGTIQAEELRGQLGDRIPGAVPIMARALGVGTAELQKMLEKGEVLANDALPKFAAELRKTFGPGLSDAVKSFQAQLNRLQNDIFELRAEFGRGFLEGFLTGFGDLREAMTDADLRQAARELGETLGAALKAAAEAAGFLSRNLGLVKVAVAGIVAFKLAGWLMAAAEGFQAAGGAAALFNKILLSNPAVAVAAALATLVVSVDEIIDSYERASQKQIDYYSSTNQAAKAIMDLAAAVRDAQAVIDETLLRGASNARVMFEGVLSQQERQLALLEKQRDSWQMNFAGGLGNAALARDIENTKEKIADARGQLELLDKVGAQLTGRMLNFNDSVTVTASALVGVSKGAKEAADAAAKLRKEIESDLAALRTPAQKFADDIGLWVERLRAGVLMAGEFQAAMAGLARQNPLDLVPEDRDPNSAAGVWPVDIRIYDAHLAQLERARQITLAMRTEAERHSDAVAEARALYAQFVESGGKAGIDAETLHRVLVANADTLGVMVRNSRFFAAGMLTAVDAIGGAIDMLADRFGGVFEELQKVIGALQQARSMYNSWSQAATDMGASASVASAAGAFGAYVALAVAAYDAFQGHIASRRSRQYGMGGSFSYDEGGFEFSSNTSAQARELARQISQTAEAFAEAIGGVIESFAALDVQIRQDGKYFKSFVGGLLVGKFETLEEAISEALLAAFADPRTMVSGLSDLVRQGLEEALSPDNLRMTGASMGEVQDWLSALREIAELEWTSGARAMAETTRHLGELWAALARVSALTPAVEQGFLDLAAAEADAWQSWRDSITGRQRSAAEQMEMKQREALLFNAQRDLYLAQLEMRKLDLKSQIEALRAQGTVNAFRARLWRDELDFSRDFYAGEANLWEQEILIQGGYLKAKGELVQGEASLVNQAIAIIEAQLRAIDAIIANMPTEIDLGEIRIPGAGGGRRQQLADFEDSLRDIIDESLPELERQARDIREEIERITAESMRLGANADLTAAAIAALNQQLADLEEAAQEARIDAFEGRIDALGLASESTRDEMASLAAMLDDLYAAMVGGYISAERYESIMRELSATMFLGLGDSLLSFLDRYYGEVEGFEDFRRQLEQVRFDLELANMQLQFQLLQELGFLTEAQIAMIQGVFDHIAENPPDWDAFFAGFERPANENFGGQGGSGAVDDIMADRAAFAERLRDILELDLDPLEKEWRRLQREIAEMMAEGQRLGFSNAELMAAQQAMIRDFWRGVTDPIREFYDELNLSDLSPLTDAQRFAEAQREAFATVAAAAQGDLQSVADLPQVLRDYLESAGANFGTAGGGYQEIFRWVQEVLRQFSQYTGGTVQPPALPGTANVVPFPRQTPPPAPPVSAQATEQDRRMLEATLEQNEILRRLLASQDARLAEERRANRQGRTGTDG